MTATQPEPGPGPSPGRDGDRRPADPDRTWPNERTQLLITTTDIDLFAAILRPALGLIASLRIVTHDQPLNVHLDDVTAGDAQRPPRLVYRRVDDDLDPSGHIDAVDVDLIAHLHLW